LVVSRGQKYRENRHEIWHRFWSRHLGPRRRAAAMLAWTCAAVEGMTLRA
jgi:hypothetical protein